MKKFIALFLAVTMLFSVTAYAITLDENKETKKEELEAIDRQIDEKAKRIAEEKVLEYLKEIENE